MISPIACSFDPIGMIKVESRSLHRHVHTALVGWCVNEVQRMKRVVVVEGRERYDHSLVFLSAYRPRAPKPHD